MIALLLVAPLQDPTNAENELRRGMVDLPSPRKRRDLTVHR